MEGLASNILGMLTPNQQNHVTGNWTELLQRSGGEQNLAMDLARHALNAKASGGEPGETGGGGLSNILGAATKLFGQKTETPEGAHTAATPSAFDASSLLSSVMPLLAGAGGSGGAGGGGLSNPNSLIMFFLQTVLGGSGANTSSSNIFNMLKQMIFGLLGEKLPAQSFGANAEAQSSWTQFLHLATNAIKQRST